ncbi:MAG: hypothetical protein WC540_00765, partial [Sulfuritalea sp.]
MKPGSQVIQRRWSSDDIAGSGAYDQLKTDLAAHTPNPWLQSLIEQSSGTQPCRIEALIGVRVSDEAGT